MFARFAVLNMLFLLAVGARAETAAQPRPNENCFDVAVIAGPPSEKAIPGTSDPNDIIGHPTWQVDMTVDRVLLGGEKRKKLRAFVVMHTQFNRAAKHWLFLLRSRPDGTYENVGGDYRVITDQSGEFIIPFAKPEPNDYLFPLGPMPRSYETLLKPVKYTPGQTWWLRDSPEAPNAVWAYRQGNYVVARRGIYLTDWARTIAQEPGAICPKR